MLKGFLFLAALGVLDLYLLYRIGMAWGIWTALAVAILPAWFGPRLAARRGIRLMERMGTRIAEGQRPEQEVAESSLIILATLLMIFPGPVTTALGLLLLFVPGLRRRLARRWTRGKPAQSFAASAGPAGGFQVRILRVGAPGDASDGLHSGVIKDVEARDLGAVSPAAENSQELPGPKP